MEQDTRKLTTRGFELLSSLFFSKGKKGIFDIPAYMFKSWCENKTIPEINEQQCVYGMFIHKQVIQGFIESYYDECEDYEENIMQFRKRCIREVIFDIEPLWLDPEEDGKDFITNKDVSDFMQAVGKNRIRDDKDLKGQISVLHSYLAGANVAWSEDNETLIVENKSHEEQIAERGLEAMEKEARKKNIAPDYRAYVDAINLNMLKNLLRDHLGRPFEPKGRQVEFLTGMKRMNFVATGRRSGKSFLASYLASRQLYIPNQSIIYIAPTLRAHCKVPRRYLFMMLKSDSNISFNRSERTITNRKNGSEIMFLSGEREDSVRGQAANLLIFDEAAFLNEYLYETATPLVRTTNGIVYAITTVDPKSPKNWFYYRLIDAEISKRDVDGYKYGRRVTLRENPFIPDEEKRNIAEEGKSNMKAFGCEWMAEFQDGDSFNFSKFWILDYRPVEIMVGGLWRAYIKDTALDKTINEYSNFVIMYDSGKLKDKPGLAVIGVKLKPNAQGIMVQDGCEVIMSGYMDGFEYRDQVKLMVDLREKLGEKKTVITIEYNQNGVAIEEIFRRQYSLQVVPIMVIGGSTFSREGRIRKVGKDLMLAKFTSAVERGVLRGYSFMEQLRIEAETYDLNESSQNRKQGHHFDILSSIFVGTFYCDKMGLLDKYNMKAEDIVADRIVNSYPEEYWHIDMGLGGINNVDADLERINKFGF